LLPALIFDAAINIDLRLLIHNLKPTLILAAPGLVLATLVTGALMSLWSPLALGPALAFGALISATDPVAVIALFRELGAPRRLSMLVDGESLFNDATAMVAFQIMCGLVAGGAMTFGVVAWAGVEFLAVFAGGTLVGALLGYLMALLLKWIDGDPLVTIACSTVVAYASFLLANYYLQVSGVMSVVGAGLVVSWFGSTRFTRAVRDYMHHFWGYAAFVANSFVFLLLGLTEFSLLQNLRQYISVIPLIGAAVLAITIARILVVFGLVPLVNRLPRVVAVDWRHQSAMFWGGLRGALPIGLALSLDHDFPGRTLIIGLTLGVVLFTLLIQGTTIGLVIRRLGLNRREPLEELARLNALNSARRAALQSLEHPLFEANAGLIEGLRQEHHRELEQLEGQTEKLRAEYRLTPEEGKLRLFWLQVNNAERQVQQEFFEQGLISENVLRRLDREAERRSEDINLGQLAPTQPKPHRREQQWLYTFLRSLAHGRFTQRPALAWLLRLLSHEYQYHLAIMLAGERVEARLAQFAQLDLMPEIEMEPARIFFEERRKFAASRLQALNYRHPEFIAALEKIILNNAAAAAAQATITQFAGNGSLSASASEELIKALRTGGAC
ncbi:MAG: cation:proton antiporter, partial [Lentisphaerae bacterium]|nr:cation:proton antiporter [Lentisphaerota bacterium]